MIYAPPVDPLRYPITSGFYAPRSYGIHAAVDYGCPTGTPVLCIGDGVVQARTTAEDAGRYIAVDHPDGLRSRYLHLSQWKVVVGQIVKRGQLVGLSGATGTASTGPHLHHDCSFATLAKARQIQPDPVLHLGRWRVNPELLFVEEDDDMHYIVLLVDGSQGQYVYDPLRDIATALSGPGKKVLVKAAAKNPKITYTEVTVTAAEIALIGRAA